MEDREILALFYSRSQQAVAEIREKYGGRLTRLAENLLGDVRDAEECVGDAYLAAWETIPPQHPEPLLPYLYRIVRNQCLKRYRRETAQKRGGGGFDAAYDELEESLSAGGDPAERLDARELSRLLDEFLKKLSKRDRQLFLGRYWYGEPYSTLAARLGLSQNGAQVRLHRLRKKLKKYLTEKEAL